MQPWIQRSLCGLSDNFESQWVKSSYILELLLVSSCLIEDTRHWSEQIFLIETLFRDRRLTVSRIIPDTNTHTPFYISCFVQFIDDQLLSFKLTEDKCCYCSRCVIPHFVYTFFSLSVAFSCYALSLSRQMNVNAKSAWNMELSFRETKSS